MRRRRAGPPALAGSRPGCGRHSVGSPTRDRRGRDAGAGASAGPPARSNLISTAQHLPSLSGRAHHASLGQLRERIRQALRIGDIIAIGRPLQPARIFDALLRLVGTNHPGARAVVIFIFGRFPRPRPAPHLGHAHLPGLTRRLTVLGSLLREGPRRLRAASTRPQYPRKHDPPIPATGIACRLRPRPGERVLDRVVAARAERRRQGIGGEKRMDLSLRPWRPASDVRRPPVVRARAHARQPARGTSPGTSAAIQRSIAAASASRNQSWVSRLSIRANTCGVPRTSRDGLFHGEEAVEAHRLLPARRLREHRWETDVSSVRAGQQRFVTAVMRPPARDAREPARWRRRLHAHDGMDVRKSADRNSSSRTRTLVERDRAIPRQTSRNAARRRARPAWRNARPRESVLRVQPCGGLEFLGLPPEGGSYENLSLDPTASSRSPGRAWRPADRDRRSTGQGGPRGRPLGWRCRPR